MNIALLRSTALWHRLRQRRTGGESTIAISIINPETGLPLVESDGALRDTAGNSFAIVAGVPRICDPVNYSASFGLQWSLFSETQIDRSENAQTASENRFFTESGWQADALAGQDILEVGSGAGRFSHVVLNRTAARLWSVDYSTAVAANARTNAAYGPDRFRLFQASVYAMPFPDDSFDKVFCLGVLQHTPDFEASVRALVAKAKPGGEIVVDFYPIKGFWTKIHAKYLLRPITRRLPHDRLLATIERNVGWLMTLADGMHRAGLGSLTRFLPLCDIRGTFPPGLDAARRREWAVLDTFDMFSPEHDHPQRIADVAAMTERAGATVEFAGFVTTSSGDAAVVRARKREAAR